MQSPTFEINYQNDETIELSASLIELYSLEKWSKDFTLMTAGYRDLLDPENAANPDVAMNLVTIAILGEAKARVFKRKAADKDNLHVHIGGETRPHTQEFICILARVYAAHGFTVHLREQTSTTPIWYSSFGVFYEEYQSGDNLTASHSQYFKGGWKPMDSSGKQLIEEEEAIISEVKEIVKSKSTINLAPWHTNSLILNDFNIDEPYLHYQESVVDKDSIAEIKKAAEKGFRCAVCPVGGSMMATTKPMFERFGISTGESGIVQYFLGEEDSQFHKIGQINGENYGVDPTKKQIYRNIGAQQKLLNKEADIVFIWDPDGDRFNMVTIASAEIAKQAINLGLEVELVPESDKCIVYFTPNQIFFMLTAHRIDALKKANLFDTHDWFIASSITTTRALQELAELENIPIVHVRVGFKHWGTFAQWLENRTDLNQPYLNAIEDEVILGKKPRMLIMCEESGGAVFGGTELLMNKSKSKGLVGMREKDGFQTGLLTLSLAAILHNSNQSFADYYCNLIKLKKIKNKHFNRRDVRLYDESLTGKELEDAKKDGMATRDKVMAFFRDLAQQFISNMPPEEICKKINEKKVKEDHALPVPKRLCLIGKGALLGGTLVEFETFWFLIRASGTDAVLRYYINGEDREEIKTYQNSLANLRI